MRGQEGLRQHTAGTKRKPAEGEASTGQGIFACDNDDTNRLGFYSYHNEVNEILQLISSISIYRLRFP